MRAAGPILALAVVLASAPSLPAADAGPLLVDAGTSAQVEVDARFPLEARSENAAAPVSVTWHAPPGCSIDDPHMAATHAACGSHGVHEFTVEVSDGVAGARDEVAMAVVAERTTRLTAAGTAGAGVPDELTAGSGEIDGANERVPLALGEDTAMVEATLDWDPLLNDLDLVFVNPDGDEQLASQGRTLQRPERVTLHEPRAGTWLAEIRPKVAAPGRWRLTATVVEQLGRASLPAVLVRGATAVPGEQLVLVAEVSGGTAPYTILWEDDPGSIRFDDGSGHTFPLTYAEPVAITAKVTDAAGFEAASTALLRTRGAAQRRPVTVVAVVDDAFSPYHLDFVGSHHPWRRDGDPRNDLDFEADPATYVDGHPGATAIDLTLPAAPSEQVGDRAATVDADAWRSFRRSTMLEGDQHLHWFPGTKIVGAISFRETWQGENASHGTRSAASAAGNVHGTCPECLLVLVSGGSEDGLRWAASQPWIDVVTNSYGTSTTPVVNDNVHLDAPVSVTRAAAESGQTIVFSAGNGLANAFDVPPLTYWSSEKGPDWVITVGAVTPGSKQTYLGHGKPVDVSSIGIAYPSTGGATAGGTGTHSGTSNAAPVVAGTIAAVLQEARALLDDSTPGHAGGIVAAGEPVACGEAWPACPLADGVLTREELHDLVLRGTSPSPPAYDLRSIPTTEHAYYYQGHGVVAGRIDGEDAYRAERGALLELLRGHRPPPARTPVEERWFVVDSYCRQRLWGAWSGGRYRGSLPATDPRRDPIAWPFRTWCAALPERALAQLGDD